MKKVTSFFIALLLGLTACEAQETKKRPTDNEAIQFAMSMGIGWNLGNQMDAHIDGVSGETFWGNPEATQLTFNGVRKAGFRSVRIPVTWMGHIGPAPTYTIERAWLDRVAELVEMAHKADLIAIVNIHHDGFGAETDAVRRGYFWLDLPGAASDEEKNQQIKQKLTMVWLQIAQRFQNTGDYLVFETLNEIQDGGWGNGANRRDGGAQYRVLNEWNQVCVNAIRAAGGQNETRYIGVPGYVCNPDLTVENLVLPEDVVANRLLVAVHSYDPWDYAGSAKYNEWGHTGRDVVPGTSEDDFVGMLNRLYNMYVRRGIPVYFGEFGAVRRATQADEEFRLYYFRYVCKAMRDRKMPALYWDNGNSKSGDDGFGVINHATGRYIGNGEQAVRAMVDSWENNDPEYTLKAVYETAPQSNRKVDSNKSNENNNHY
ncbi:MAG: glycoside hydrolase family 5 protein [Paludibacteraceae bacterium]|nr:glycoside hydrolase family 5 protein [Paludibacteraceae bacterium]